MEILQGGKTNELIVKIVHSIDEKVAGELKTIKIALQSLAVSVIIFCVLLFAAGLLAFFSIGAVDDWVRETIRYAGEILV